MAQAEQAIDYKVVVAGAQALVREAVDEEIDAGMQVRDHRRVEVNGQRKLVVLVRQQNNGIRSPAYAENEEDDEDDLDLPDRLDDGRLTVPGAQAAAAGIIARLQNAQLGFADVREDAPVAENDDDERQQHADGDVEQRVLVRLRPVPQTLLRLAVERVSRPAGVTRHVERRGDQPRRQDDGEAGAPTEEATVSGLVADVDVTIDADGSDAEQRDDAAADAEAGKQRTQPLTTAVEQRRTDDRTCTRQSRTLPLRTVPY